LTVSGKYEPPFTVAVVGDDHALPALDDADAGDDPRPGSLAVVGVPGRERVRSRKAVPVDETVDALACEQPCRAIGGARSRASPPPAATCAVRARSSATSASIRARRPREVVGALDAALQEGHREEPNGASGMLPA